MNTIVKNGLTIILGVVGVGLAGLVHAKDDVSPTAPVSVLKQPALDLYNTTHGDIVTIRAVADQVTIESYKLNRGNCEYITNHKSNGESYAGDPPLPITLKFGESYTLKPPCTILEIQVATNIGTWVFNWQQ